MAEQTFWGSFWETIASGVGSYLDILKQQEMAKVEAAGMEYQIALVKARAELERAEAEAAEAGKTTFEKALPWIIVAGIGYYLVIKK